MVRRACVCGILGDRHSKRGKGGAAGLRPMRAAGRKGQGMEPLFENHVKLDEETLLEWHRAELAQNGRLASGLQLALVVLYLVMAAFFGFMAVWMALRWMWAFCGVFVLCAALFALNMVLRPTWQVRKMVRRDEKGTYGRVYVTQFYEDGFVAMCPPEQLPTAKKLADCHAGALGLRQEMEQLAALQAAGDMRQMPQKLQSLQQRMEQLRAETAALNRPRTGYQSVEGCSETKHLLVLSCGQQVTLVDKRGFKVGDSDGFIRFINKKLGPKQKKETHRED